MIGTLFARDDPLAEIAKHSNSNEKKNPMSSGFKQRLRSGEALIGPMITLASSEVIEVMTLAGFDWLFIDGEHGPLEPGDLRALLTAAGETPCLVRVPAIDQVPIKKALDLGAAGVIVPQVNSAEDAAKVVSWCRYPPVGSRGVGLGRAHGYGKTFQEYVERANDDVLVVVQAEHKDAVDSIEGLVRVPGVDCVFLGPYDLSASYGKTGQLDDPEIVAAIARVESVCKSNNMPLGFFGLNAEAVQPYIERGFSLICAGLDTVMLGSAAGRILKPLRSAV